LLVRRPLARCRRLAGSIWSSACRGRAGGVSRCRCALVSGLRMRFLSGRSGSGRGLAGFAGWWWMASTGRHVGFESWLERDHLMLLDFGPDVTAVSSQPFWLRWQGEDGRDRRHAPDFFVRLADGAGVVVDIRPDDRIPEKDAEVFAVTAAACSAAGWEFRRRGEVDPVLVADVRWLSRYRHPRCAGAGDVADVLLEVFAGGEGLFAGAELAGERLRVLPVLFHLMWRGHLVAGLSEGPLGPATLVRTGERR
jgi:hypothetical protein